MKIYGYMYDSAAGTFPQHSRLNAYYYNGLYASHYPYSTGRGRIWIDVLGNAPEHCSILDVERGDATPAHVPAWLDERDRIGTGIVYCNRSTLPQVISYAGNREFNLWLATLDGSIPEVTVPHGKLLAVQTWDSGRYDVSAIVNEEFWNLKAA